MKPKYLVTDSTEREMGSCTPHKGVNAINAKFTGPQGLSISAGLQIRCEPADIVRVKFAQNGLDSGEKATSHYVFTPLTLLDW